MTTELTHNQSSQSSITQEHIAHTDKLAWVLSPGLLRGWLQFGVMDKLYEMGVYPDLIVGSSIGSYVGIIPAAQRDIDFVRRIHKEYDRRVILAKNYTESGLFSNNRAIDFLREHFGQYQNLEDLPIPLITMVTDSETMESVALSEGPLFSAIQASIANPMLYPPVALDGRYYLDGGLSNPAPIDVARRFGAKKVIYVDSFSKEFKRPIPNSEQISPLKRFLLRVAVNNETPVFGKLYFMLKLSMVGKGMYKDLMDCYMVAQNQLIQRSLQLTPPDVYINIARALEGDTAIPLSNKSFQNGDYFITRGRLAADYYHKELESLKMNLVVK